MIPKAGVERAYIEGQNYIGTQMIYGTKGISGRSIPPVDQAFTDRVRHFEGKVQIWDDLDSVVCSFSDEAIHFVDDGIISLKNNVLKGQILESRDSIFIGADAKLEDVVLKGRVVYVQKGFKGNLQIYATERIILEDQVQLTYPSVLGVMEEIFPEKENAEIIIGEKSQVLGSVFAVSEAPNFRLPVQISVEKEAEVHGLLYNQGRTQLKGMVNGSLYTNKFYLETPSSKYENHLLNATIKDELPEGFVYISIMASNEPLTKIEWLQ